ncbi:XdhC/CoxI family protein [Actinotalea sp. Marseille-Q4924]|uniref:XdhC family protein n=1 Tax=Actinotalea sp. Marseille-Q4924 TaxID=2866571 RepID=UPI001CE3D74C|nr:XdhC/CoxI family protein [Actinotalea sp. Marseille-Q4924]
MKDVLPELHRWWCAGRPVAMATVVQTWRSAPRPAGATMLVGPDGEAVGSVSGGCVEAALHELGTEVQRTGVPVLQRYGVSDDDAGAVGLTCGGTLDVFVQRVDPTAFPELEDVVAAVGAGIPVAVATVVAHPDPARVGRRLVVVEDRGEVSCHGGLGGRRLDDAVREDARGLLAAGRTGVLTYGPDGERRGEGARVLVEAWAPAPRMIVFGAIDFAAALARMGAFLGYRVTVCDARPVFATVARFPEAPDVVVDWPHRYLRAQADRGLVDGRTVLAVLTHDPKFDVPVLEVALRLDVAYVGAMGSRRTHEDRLARLRAAGVQEHELARLSSPIGLDLGARTPEETAVSIAAEVIARSWGGRGAPLSAVEGPIHHDLSGLPVL